MLPILQKKASAVVLIVALFWLGHSLYSLYFQRQLASDQLADIKQKVSNIKKENQFLASASAYFQSNAYLERQARLKLNYKLPDENVAFVYKNTPSQSSETNNSGPASIWQKFWHWLMRD